MEQEATVRVRLGYRDEASPAGGLPLACPMGEPSWQLNRLADPKLFVILDLRLKVGNRRFKMAGEPDRSYTHCIILRQRLTYRNFALISVH